MKPVNTYGITRAYSRPISVAEQRREIRDQRQGHYDKVRAGLRDSLASRINVLPQPADFPSAFLYQTAMDVYSAGKKAIVNLAAALQTRVFRMDEKEFAFDSKFNMLIFDDKKPCPLGFLFGHKYPHPVYFQVLIDEGMAEIASTERFWFSEAPFPNLPPELADILPPQQFRDSTLSIIMGEHRFNFMLYHYCALLDTAFAFKNKGQIAEAILWHKIAILINPSFEHAYLAAGYLYATQGKLEKALEMYQQLLEVDPNLPEARENLAITYIGLGRHDEAFEQFALCLKLHPENTRVHFLKAKLILQLGKTAKAIDYCRRYFLDQKNIPDEAILAFLQSDTLIS